MLYSRLLRVLFLGTVTASLAQADLSHRQSALTVTVKNLADVPLEGANVKVEMLNPAFRWGTAITADELIPGRAAYSEQGLVELQRYFNSVTFGNYLKWSYVESRTTAQTQAMIDEVFELGAFGSGVPMGQRGHTTVWGAEYQLPASFRSLTDPAAVRQRIRDHVTEYHTALRDSGIVTFDLYNEHFHEREYIIDKAVPGGSVDEQAAEIAEWFKAAQAADPDAKLYINEYNILNFWQENDSDVIAYKEVVDAIRDAGGPVGGIGLQAHMDRMITKAQVTRRLNLLSAPMAPTANHPAGLPGLPIEITELDINTNWWTAATPADQAQVTANVLEGAFEHPAVEGITMWGMRDSLHWRDNSILFDDTNPANWVIKPSGQVWVDRVKGTWWTNTGGLSDGTGSFDATVFKGRHRVTVTFAGETQTFVRDLASDETLAVTFDAEPIDTTNSYLSNLSVRTDLAANQALTLGFVVDGGAKDLLLRAGGPALAQFSLPGMPDPEMEVYGAGEVLVAQNDDWDASLAATANTLGAYAWTEGSADAALQPNISGSNTARIAGDEAGLVLVEAYDVTPGVGPRLVNISAQNRTGSGSSVLTAGFVVGGTGHIRLLIRGIGPRLQEYGVPGTLANPRIQVFSGNTVVAENDDWDASLASVFADVGAFELTAGSSDAALVTVLPADGNLYTVQVTGADGGTGVALVEVYELR